MLLVEISCGKVVNIQGTGEESWSAEQLDLATYLSTSGFVS